MDNRLKNNYSITSTKYWNTKRSVKHHNKWIKIIQKELEENSSNFAKALNKKITETQRTTYLSCKPNAESKEFLCLSTDDNTLFIEIINNKSSKFELSYLEYISSDVLKDSEETLNAIINSKEPFLMVTQTKNY